MSCQSSASPLQYFPPVRKSVSLLLLYPKLRRLHISSPPVVFCSPATLPSHPLTSTQSSKFKNEIHISFPFASSRIFLRTVQRLRRTLFGMGKVGTMQIEALLEQTVQGDEPWSPSERPQKVVQPDVSVYGRPTAVLQRIAVPDRNQRSYRLKANEETHRNSWALKIC